MASLRLLIATSNPHKLAEYAELLARLTCELVRPRGLNLAIDIDESGSTYQENARLKALAFAAAAPECIALADDSGLELAAFDDWPGLHSVRFAGPTADDAERRRLILERLAEHPLAHRQARFVCAVAVARASTILAESIGTLSGSIGMNERGTTGFGYDPIFVPLGEGRSLGEMTSREKNVVSHRARAVAQILPFLQDLSMRDEEEGNGGKK